MCVSSRLEIESCGSVLDGPVMKTRTAAFGLRAVFALRSLIISGVIIVGGCAGVPTETDATFIVPERIEAAKTPEDNETLARHYEELASAARQQAQRHREALKTYQYSTFAHRYQKGGHIPVMERHCEALIRNSEEAAEIYANMSAQHRALAAQGPVD
jgi:hypothetical protein